MILQDKTVIVSGVGPGLGGEVARLAVRDGANVVVHVRDISTTGGTIKLPDERAGLAFVFRVFNRVSYALIMTISKPISPLDVVQTP